MSKPFPWGIVNDRTTLYLGEEELEIIWYTSYSGDIEQELVCCEKLHESFKTIDALLIAWIAQKNLGNNQHQLVSGVCRALGVKE